MAEGAIKTELLFLYSSRLRLFMIKVLSWPLFESPAIILKIPSLLSEATPNKVSLIMILL